MSSTTTNRSQISEDGRPRVEITEKMYIEARDEVGREIICMLNNLQHSSTQSVNLGLFELWTTNDYNENLAKLKSHYSKIHTRRASIQLGNKPEAIAKRKELIQTYAKVLKYLSKLETQIPAEHGQGAEIITNTRAAQNLNRAISDDTMIWTRKRFRRVDYSLMHQIWRRLNLIKKLVPKSKRERDLEAQCDDKSIRSTASTASSVATLLTGDHPSLAPSQISVENSSEEENVASSEYSCHAWSIDSDQGPQIRQRKSAKNPTKLSKPETSATSGGIALGHYIHMPESYKNYRDVDFDKCLLNSDCNCYHCFPLNIPEDDEEFSLDDQIDAMGILWDIKDCSEPPYKYTWDNMTEAERKEQERVTAILRNFEKAIQEAEDMTAANLFWDICCSGSTLAAQFWNFMKTHKCRVRMGRVAPIDYDYDPSLPNRLGRDSTIRTGERGDYVEVPIE